MKNEEYELLLDEEDKPILVEGECEELKPVIEDFVKSYTENSDKPVKTWLVSKMQEEMPEKTPEEIEAMVEEIIATIEVDEEKQESLNEAVKKGKSKESWFASETKKATSGMANQEAAKYLGELDDALKKANESLRETIHLDTNSNIISQNPCLDGYIAEQYHAQTFNLNAKARGSQYEAKVLKPDGAYAKNSVDIVIVDKEGRVVRRYQSKYCKDARATERAFEQGDYRGQQKLVPEGQENSINKKCTIVLEAPDGTTSNPLEKNRAEQMRDEAQSGNWNELNWNEYALKDLAKGIGKQAGHAAIQGAAIGVGMDVAQKLWNGEEIEADEIVETAITTGADFGVKAAAAGALKVGSEKEIIKVIPKGTPASTVANIAFVAVEDIKVLGKMADGELTAKEGLEKIEQTTVSTTAGLMTMAEGAAIGETVGLVFGPIGAAVGGFVGGTLGYMAGSKVGEKVVKVAQKVRDKAVDVVKSVATGVKDAVTSVGSAIANFLGF